MSEGAGETTLYDRIGGDAAVSAAVGRFYERVLADPDLKGFFNPLSMPRLKAHQIAFLSQVLGGPRQYGGAAMRDAHSRLAIEQRHFDGVTVHLVETLRELGVSEELLTSIGAALRPLSGEIVNTSGRTTAL